MRFLAITLLVLVSILAACGSTSHPAPGNSAYISDQLAQLDRLAAPEGVDAKTWAELKQALRVAIQAAPRSASETSTKPSSAAQADIFFSDLHWYYSLAGDFDQNGEVNISDLTPLGVNLGQSNGGVPYNYSSVKSVVDGDNNGEINIADITTIGANLGKRCNHYNVYQSNNSNDYPSSPDAADTVTPVGEAALAGATGAKNVERLSFSYPLPGGGGNFWVRIADGSSIGTASNMISGEGSPTAPPVATFEVDTASGDAPLTVNFDASASTGGDGYDWDFDGDGADEEFGNSDPHATFTYDTPGRYHARLSMENNRGTAKAFALIVVTGAGGVEPPQAQVTATPDNSTAPVTVTFDASASIAPGGALTTVDFDTNNDGDYDVLDVAFPAGSTTVNYTLDQAGTYDIQARVHDSNGNTDVAHAELHILSAWTVVPDVAPDYPYAQYPTLIGAVNNVPAVLFGAYYSGLVYKSALDTMGNTWGPATTVDYNDSYGSIKAGALLEVDGKPAVAYIETYSSFDPPHTTSIIYRRANDAAGTSWGGRNVVMDLGEENPRSIKLKMINGKPAIAFTSTGDRAVVYVHASDSIGGSWGTPVNLAPVEDDFANWVDLEEVSGAPAVIYRYNFYPGMRYRRATDPDGGAWGTELNIKDELGGPDADYGELLMIAGRPVIVFYDRGSRDLHYARSDDANGDAWSSNVTVPNTGECFGGSAVEYNGRCMIAYEDDKRINEPFRIWEAYSSYAADADGSSWERVPIETGYYALSPTLMLIGGIPMVCYQAADPSGENGTVRFARLN